MITHIAPSTVVLESMGATLTGASFMIFDSAVISLPSVGTKILIGIRADICWTLERLASRCIA